MAAGAARDDSSVAAPRPPASRWSRRRGFVLAAVADSEPSEDDAADAGRGTSTGPVFDAPTNTVLLFSDRIDGVTALDLDAGVAGRRVIQGEPAGDQPYRINLTGDHLVVGWGEIYAAPLDGGPSRPIDEATIYMPAAEPGEVWTVDYRGGRIGQGGQRSGASPWTAPPWRPVARSTPANTSLCTGSRAGWWCGDPRAWLSGTSQPAW